jgi:pimeloyl-ACP methyl ester carboxylesterase
MKKNFFLILAVIGMCSTEINSQMTTTSQTVNEKYIELQERVTLHYVEQGDPQGIPVILLHGIGDSWHSFELVLPYLPKNIHLYAITQRGHGGSGRPHYGYAPENFARDIAAFMENLDIKQAVIVGHSMGATVAQCFAIQYPELTKGLVLAGSFARLQSNPSVAEFEQALEAMGPVMDKNFAQAFQQSTLVKPVPAVFFDTMVTESTKMPGRVWRAIMKELVRADFTEEMETITVPALLIWGDKDGFCTRADQDALLGSIPGSKLIVYKETGHAVHWEEPKRFADDLLKFIADITKEVKK